MSSTSPLNATMAVQLLKHRHFAPQATVGCSGSAARVFVETAHLYGTLRDTMRCDTSGQE